MAVHIYAFEEEAKQQLKFHPWFLLDSHLKIFCGEGQACKQADLILRKVHYLASEYLLN
jgi:hypothetical protein